MLRIEFKILPKKRGNFLPQLIAKREYLESDDLKLNPRFVFEKEYKLPGTVYLTRNKEMKLEQNGCKTINTLTYKIDSYRDKQYGVHIRSVLSHDVCEFTCSDCRAFLEWRPGAKPDYSDFAAVFEQVAKDMMEAWRQAVAEAYASGENDEVDIVFSSDTYVAQKQEEEVMQRPSRKVKVE